MGIFDKLKKYIFGTGGQARGAGRILQPIDTTKIARGLDLARRERENGLRSQPTSESTAPDDVELSVIQLVESEWRSETGNIVDELKSYATRLQSLNIEA